MREPSVITAQSSLMLTMRRFVADMTASQIAQHRDSFEAVTAALDAFLASPKAAGIHRDSLLFWNSHRAIFHSSAVALDALIATMKPPVRGAVVQTHTFQTVQPSQPPAAPATAQSVDYAKIPQLANIRQLIAKKSPIEILLLRDELRISLASFRSGNLPVSAGQCQQAHFAAQFQQRALEVAYLSTFVD